MATNPFDESNAPKKEVNPFDESQAPKQNKGFAGDAGTAVKQGVLGLPGMAAGLADIPAGLVGLDRPVGRATDAIGKAIGFQPKKWAQDANSEYSPQTQAGKAEIEKAWDSKDTTALDVAAAYAKNPRTTALNAIQSVPSMVAGGLAGRAIGGVAGIASGTARAAIGEGATMAGQAMDQTDQSVDPRRAAVAALATGAVGGAIGFGAGKVADKFGILNPDTIATAGTRAGAVVPKSIFKRVPIGMAQEGLLEEAPQSAIETASQNWAEGKALTEGMARNVTEGALAGGLMGGAFAAAPQKMEPTGKETPPPAPIEPPAGTPDAGPGNRPQLGFNPIAGTPVIFPDGTVALGSEAELQKRTGAVVPKPSEAMGLDPAAGPMSAAAALSVDSGASDQAQADALAEQQASAPKAKEDAPKATAHRVSGFMGGDETKPVKTMVMATTPEEAIAAVAKSTPNMVPVSAEPVNGSKSGAASPTLAAASTQSQAGGTQDGNPSDIPAALPIGSGRGSDNTGPGLEAGVGLGNAGARTMESGRTGNQYAGEPVSQPVNDGANALSTEQPAESTANVQDAPAPAAGTQSQEAPAVEAGATSATVPATAPGVPAAGGTGAVQADGVNQRQSAITQATTAAQQVLKDGGTEADANRAATDLLIESMAKAPDIAIATDAPAAVKAARDAVATPITTTKETTNVPQADQAQQASAQQPQAPAAATEPAAGELTAPKAPVSVVAKAAQKKAIDRVAKGTAYFGTQEKANEFVKTGFIADTHEVVQAKPGRFEIRAKSDAVSNMQTADADPNQADGPAKVWAESSPANRRELLRQSGYTDGDQARAFSGTEWNQLSDTVRQALDKPTSIQGDKPASVETRRGTIGMKLGDGEVVKDQFGNQTTPFPKVSLDTDRKTQNTVRAVDRWLIQNALRAAQTRGDQFNERQFQAVNNLNITQADKDSAEQYLFGDEAPAVVPSILQPLAQGKTPAAAEPTRDTVVNVPPTVSEAMTGQMQKQKSRISRLKREADAPGMTLDEKKSAQTKVLAAETTLRKMRTSVFDAEDSAVTAVQTKDAAAFAEHADLFPDADAAIKVLTGQNAEPAPALTMKEKADQANQRRMDETLKNLEKTTAPAAKTDALTEKEAAAKAKMFGALGKLAALASKNTRLNWTPEEEQQLLPIVIELFDGAMDLGAVTFQKAVRYVREFIATGLNQKTADAIPFETLQGAYIHTARKFKDQGATSGKEVMNFDSLEELEALAETDKQADTETEATTNDPTTPGNSPALDSPMGSGLQPAGSTQPVRGARKPRARSGRSDDADLFGSGGRLDAAPDEEGLMGDRDGPTGVQPGANGVVAGSGQRLPSANYRPQPGGLTRQGSWLDTAKRNIDLIDLAIAIDKEGRKATPEEQAQLSKYVGFGAGEIRNKIFPVPPAYAKSQDPNRLIWSNYVSEPSWKALAERMEALPREWQKSVLQSSQYAHYTSEGIIRSVWSGIERLGFTGGKVFEPGMGIGSFAMLMPENVAATSKYTGVEFDGPTALIARLLSPDENMLHGDFIKRKFPKDFFDVNVGNPPFSQTKILGDPAYEKFGFMLHDFFFAKGIDSVRPGGLQVFVTSKGTMDKQNDKARKYLSDRADLLGAIRLPSTAFEGNAGTSVVTDVIFLRKRLPGEAPSGQPWNSLATVETKDGPVMVNEYYAANPDMVLGQQRISGNVDDMGRRINSNGMGGAKYTVVSYDTAPGELDAKFAKAIEALPENAYSVMSQSPESIKRETAKVDFDPTIKHDGAVYLAKDGTIMRVTQGAGRPLENEVKLSPKDKAWFTDYVQMRDLVQLARQAQNTDGAWEAALKKLNKAYDQFRATHGPITDFRVQVRKSTDEEGNVVETETRVFKNKRLYREDYDQAVLTSIEKINEAGEIVKAPFLLGRTIGKPVTREVKSIGDALAVSLDNTGIFDIEDVAARMKMTREEAVSALDNQVYQDLTGNWLLADEYLSGNVVDKLEEAEEAARLNPAFERNVEALKKVQPEKLGPSQISAKLGASWIPAAHVNEFAEEIGAGEVTFDSKTETWQVEGANLRSGRMAGAEYGTAKRSPSELLESALNSRSIKITMTIDKKTVTDEEGTTAANEAMKKIKAKFKGWIWTDTERAAELVEGYNKRFNNLAPRVFDGSHLTLPGVSLRFKLHPHQLRAILRQVQTGDTYLAHAVGAGKTIEMIAGGMEQKRLGLINKPMYVVPNHMLEQFSNEFMELYPLANIMVADDENFSAERRKAFIAAATLNAPDAIVITHDAYQRIGVKEESVEPIRDEIISDLEIELSQTAKGNDSRVRRSQLEQQIESVTQRFDRIISAGGKDATIKFEDMGVDFVYVDEAHAFRKLDFHTAQQVKGIDPMGSKRALDMYVKTRILQKQRPGRAMVFATGTPVTNTMGELYTIMRFFAPKMLEEAGISSFDAWARQFAEVAPALEQNAAGKYEVVERFAKFDNVPELMSRVRSFMDVLTSEHLGSLVKRPDLIGGKPNLNVVNGTPALKSYMDGELARRIEISKAWKPSPEEKGNPDPIVSIITDGRFAALDPRFFGQQLKAGETSILTEMADKVVAGYKAYADNVYTDKNGKPEKIKGGTQIVFYNLGFGEAAKRNRGFDSRAAFTKSLTDGGIPRAEIAWFDDANTDAKKESVFKDMRSGKLKVLIGSAKKMGTGVNVQSRLRALHYQDPPWYPSDVEQPHGRIIRQGNQNPEVGIEWYTTKGTYQSTMWQMVGRKQRFIDQAFTGDKNLRSMDDLGEASLFEQAAAVASGDPRALQLAGLKQDVERLERLQAAHASEQVNVLSSLRSAQWYVKSATTAIKGLEHAFKSIGERYFSFTSGTVGNATFTKPGEFGQAIKEAFNRNAMNAIMSPTDGSAIKLGDMGQGIEITMEQMTDSKGVPKQEFAMSVEFGGTRNVITYAATLDSDVDAVGLSTRLRNAVNGVETSLRNERTSLKTNEADVTRLTKKLGAPFEYQQEMLEKYGELKELEESLRLEGLAPKDQPKPVGVTVLTGKVADKSGNLRQTGAPEGNEADVLFSLASREDSQAPFYSALSREVEQIATKSAPAVGWQMALQGMVKNGKIKADELEWSGLTDWLKLQEGKVTKEQITEYLDANGVQVEEVTLGGDVRSEDKQRAIDDLKKLGYLIEDEYGEGILISINSGERYTMGDNGFEDENGDPLEDENLDEVEEVAQVIGEFMSDDSATTDTKYSQYTLPGGTNYREVLLTLPTKADADVEELLALDRIPDSELTDDQRTRAKELIDRGARKRDVGYRSGHWDQKNVISHLRVNDRIDSDGRRVLFVEELQSDWQQQARKEGFIGDPVAARFPTEEKAAFANSIASGGGVVRVGDEWSFKKKTGVPLAPFVGNTDKWLALSLKRVIKMAVDGGYDRVAFVNGEQSAERYDLSKQISEINYEPTDDGLYEINAKDMSGKTVLDEDEVSLARIEELVGKEIAKKIEAGEGKKPQDGYRDWHTLSGLDLKVGGEGMKAFYDKIVPSALKDVLKKVGGGQVEGVAIPLTTKETTLDVVGADGSVLMTTEFDSLAHAFSRENPGSKVVPTPGRNSAEKQPGFTITDAMRDKAAGGLPLFSSVDGKANQANTEAHEPATQDHIAATTRLSARLDAKTEGGYDGNLLDAVTPGRGPRGQHARSIAGIVKRIFNREVVYVRFKGEPYFNGVVTSAAPGKIFINIDSDKPMLAVLGHELLHEMAKSQPQLYKLLSDRLDGIIKNETRFSSALVDKYRKAGVSTRGLDTREELEADIVGDNFMDPAFWAALGEDQPSLMKRIVAAVLKWLDSVKSALSTSERPMGTDAFLTDIAAARAAVVEGMRQFSQAEAGTVADQAPSDSGSDTKFSLNNPEGLGNRMGEAIKTVTVQDVKRSIGNKMTDYMGLGLQALGRRQLVDIYGKDLPLDEYNKLAQQMEADKNEGGAEADKIATDWGKLKDEQALAELMHDATLAQIDPEKALVPTDNALTYMGLKSRFNKLSDEAKSTYRAARDGYKAHHENVRQAIKERIERSELKGERKAELLKKMDDDFFKAIKGVYFPLARFGQYVVVTKTADGKVHSVNRAETMSEAEALRRSLVSAYPKANGYDVGKVILSKEFIASRDSVGRGFMTELYDVLEKQDIPAAQLAELEDTLGQLYLSSMPDLSWAKHGIHRKGTAGFSQDARRAFAQNMFHGSRYLAKLRYSDLMQDELTAMQEHVDGIANVLPDEDGFNGPRLQRVVDEMNKRHESLMNPKSNPLSTALTSAGFVFFLGLSPASALVNLSQTAFVAYPIMAAKWGYGKSASALLKASEQAAKGKNDIRSVLNDDEKAAYDEAVRSGTIDVTMAHDLAGIAQGEDSAVTLKMRPVMRWASFMFHHAEKFNRQVTFVAAYRLAREAGANHLAAYDQATKATYDGHFDYGAGNRPRVMQGNAAKVLLLFKQYGQNMVYTLSRQAYLASKGDKQAQKAIAGLLVSHSMGAGVLGLPLASTLLAAASMFGGDDDDPWDAKVALQNMLAESLGQKPTEVLMHGLSRLTPWDISGRVGLDRLLLPDVQEGLEGQRLGESVMAASLGPVAGIGLGVLKGLQKMSNGEYQRGLEDMMPSVIRNAMKGLRYADEGAQDRTGISILDEVSPAAYFGQALGFSPSEVRNASEGKGAIFDLDRRLSNRRSDLMRMFTMASMAGDAEGAGEVRNQIMSFNAKNPGRAITMLNLMQSMKAKARRVAESDKGVYLPRNRRDAMRAGAFAQAEEEAADE